jgi:DNA-binding NarL/FixJ family response regulator
MPNQTKHSEKKKKSDSKNLSCRECEIIAELSRGTSNKFIAASLDVTINTVEKHLTSIYKKLSVKSRTEAILWWIENGRVFRN